MLVIMMDQGKELKRLADENERLLMIYQRVLRQNHRAAGGDAGQPPAGYKRGSGHSGNMREMIEDIAGGQALPDRL